MEQEETVAWGLCPPLPTLKTFSKNISSSTSPNIEITALLKVKEKMITRNWGHVRYLDYLAIMQDTETTSGKFEALACRDWRRFVGGSREIDPRHHDRLYGASRETLIFYIGRAGIYRYIHAAPFATNHTCSVHLEFCPSLLPSTNTNFDNPTRHNK